MITRSGKTTVLYKLLGIGSSITSSLFLPLINVIPPKRAGAILSACASPETTFSPSIPCISKSFKSNGFPRKLFTPKIAAAALAALEPKPPPFGIPFSICKSNP